MEKLSVTLQKPHSVCVIDPALVLCKHGLQGIGIVKHLGPWIELWIAGALWDYMESPAYYLNYAYETSYSDHGQAEDSREPTLSQRSIAAWEKIRLQTDLISIPLYWMRDALYQSRFPAWMKEGIDPEKQLQRYEILAQTLDSQLHSRDLQNPLMTAYRDTTALAATIWPAFILSAQQLPDRPPHLVQCLERWGISCQQKSLTDPIVSMERNKLHDLFVQGGCPQLLWMRGFHLAVIHLHLPAAFDSTWLPDPCAEESSTEVDDHNQIWEFESMTAPSKDLPVWEEAQVFWYPLANLSEDPPQGLENYEQASKILA